MNATFDAEARAAALAARFACVRRATERLSAPLSDEDCVVQSMQDASPVKWHLAHTTWFFETLVLAPHAADHRPYRDAWSPLFNSYYEALGARHPRPQRGLLTRPSRAEVGAYREAIDEQVQQLLSTTPAVPVLDLVELGVHHEEQHQELVLTDVLHALSCNPLGPAYDTGPSPAPSASAGAREWIEHPGGLEAIGHAGASFSYDNERPHHRVHLAPFALSSQPVTCDELLAFIDDGGYRRPELWLSDGWRAVNERGWHAPLYWAERDGRWQRYTLYGWIDVDRHGPVAHVSYYEADAFARWAGARLPTEAEWEVVARARPQDGQFVEDRAWVPTARHDARGLSGGTWTWTSSAYAPYPGFEPLAGPAAEYNGKFMVNQLVLRGGSAFTPRDHVRVSYRNFFPPDARWQLTGIRLARGR